MLALPSHTERYGTIGARTEVPLALVLGKAGEDSPRDLIPVLRVLQAPLLAGIAHEPDLDEDGRHGGTAEHVEARLLHAAVGNPQRLRHGILHDLGEARRLRLVLGLRE